MNLGPRQFVALVAVLAAVALGLAGDVFGLEPAQAKAAALLVATVGLWATQAIPESVTALAFLGLATLSQVAPPETIFAGFAATAFWLVAGGLLMASAMRETGLAERFACTVGRRLATSYPVLVSGVVVLATLFAVLVPVAMGRVVILVPLVQALARSLGLEAWRPGHYGLIMAAVLGTMAPGFAILTSNLPNLVLAGAAETLYDLRLGYGQYLLASFPVLGLLKLPIIVATVLKLFPDRIAPPTKSDRARPWSAAERRLLALILATITLWMTDWLHGFSAGGIALAAGVLCLLPRVGFLDPTELGRDLNIGTLLYVAAVLGLVKVVAVTGLAAGLAERLLGLFPLNDAEPAGAYAVTLATGAAVAVTAGFPIVAAVLAPMAGPMAETAGIPVAAVLLSTVAVFSIILLPHQEAPVAVGVHLGRVPAGRAARLFLATALTFTILLAPLHFLWLRLLGIFDG